MLFTPTAPIVNVDAAGTGAPITALPRTAAGKETDREH